jgi:hypothetical protein
MGTLKDYFAAILDPEYVGPPATSRQQAEYHILKSFFDLNTARYLSIPLVLFGEFDGVMHFVYCEEDARALSSRGLASLIRSSSALYETQILEWDLVGRNPEKSKAVLMPIDASFYEHINRNPILRELGFKEYYRKYLGFYQRRIRFNDDVLHSKVYRPYLKSAITAIMIDSFAHNVSAHSLVALNWWFKQRAENLRLGIPRHQAEVVEVQDMIRDFVPEGFDQDRLLQLLRPWFHGLFVKNADPTYDLLNFPGSLAREIQPLLKFLMQKGAFWSGISRDHTFGGESVSMFDVLWNDFINNPLYLGTIAKSESIHRLRIRVFIYEAANTTPGRRDLVLEEQEKRVLTEGVLVEVDLKKRRPTIITHPNGKRGYPLHDGECLCLETYPELDEMSDFVRPGAAFPELKAVLSDCRVFLPGEVVGRHAFFTLLENKIRNVKHFKGATLQQMQDEGLELCLSFQETPIHPGVDGDKALIHVGVWINAISELFTKDGAALIDRHYDQLRQDIMDVETFAPRLGGSYQDKLCAGMLFNNYFLHVQNGDENELRDQLGDTERDRIFYPWIMPVAGAPDNMHRDRLPQRENRHTPATLQQQGYFKKYFYLWKAAELQWVEEKGDLDLVWDNMARFRFIGLRPEAAQVPGLREGIRREGVLRIIQPEKSLPANGDQAVVQAYRYWLKQWIGQQPLRCSLHMDQAVIGQFHFRPDSPQVLAYEPVWAQRDQASAPVKAQTQVLHLAHGGESDDYEVLRYRSHGIYVKYFQAALQPNQPLDDRAQARMSELFEMLATRICVFDSRVYYRLGHSQRHHTLGEQLRLHVFDESDHAEDSIHWLDHWERHRKWIMQETHFLILHLSFIEKILHTKYSDHPDYSDENIGLFIQEEVLPYLQTEDGQVRENFVLVITTGRGRTKWWTQLTEQESYQPYQNFTIFRPVESIISAIEDAVNRKDDLEVKYNLVKVMFGS